MILGPLVDLHGVPDNRASMSVVVTFPMHAFSVPFLTWIGLQITPLSGG
jgi:hypothetical protein